MVDLVRNAALIRSTTFLRILRRMKILNNRTYSRLRDGWRLKLVRKYMDELQGEENGREHSN